jgi:hypothetical protein
MRPPADPASILAFWTWVSVLGVAATVLILVASWLSD